VVAIALPALDQASFSRRVHARDEGVGFIGKSGSLSSRASTSACPCDPSREQGITT
jgi:epoxyqueuosine reductase QueG